MKQSSSNSYADINNTSSLITLSKPITRASPCSNMFPPRTGNFKPPNSQQPGGYKILRVLRQIPAPSPQKSSPSSSPIPPKRSSILGKQFLNGSFMVHGGKQEHLTPRIARSRSPLGKGAPEVRSTATVQQLPVGSRNGCYVEAGCRWPIDSPAWRSGRRRCRRLAPRSLAFQF